MGASPSKQVAAGEVVADVGADSSTALTSARHIGRPRDAAIDAAVLAATRRLMATKGLTALSIAAVADEAGTTRPSIYRRWPTKLDLALAAVADLADVDPPAPGDDPFEDLVAELAHFAHCITDAAALALAGVMLQDDVDQAFRDAYREQLVVPRRARLRACLTRGVESGALDPEADIAVAGSMMTGSWYAFAIAGAPPPTDWARRVAALVWRACGG